ncbi:T9SS type A sorting domain-containing protein, partial [Pseudoalteromonas fuliginea]|uniref:T9SS type A sorting domain-containing protein n=2 Tax=Pseudomonadati TaxID=3379134 RepID=UPI000518FB41
DIIQFTTTDNITMTNAYIYDISGKLVISEEISDLSISAQQLTKGTYVMILKDTNGKHYSTKIIKE